MSTLGILNVGAGDTKITFDPTNPQDAIRAARIIKDMLRRGYALLVENGKDADGRPLYSRAYDFDEKKCEYIIADYDPTNGGKPEDEPIPEPTAAPRLREAEPKGRKAPRKRVPATGANAVAVARSAGG